MNAINEDTLISVIIPVYKVEEYLDECVESVINQTYRNLEIILVDDGSPDNCGNMCDQYALQDSRIKVIHKENGGLSDARNAGRRASTGDYITYIDSDDVVSIKYIEHMYSLAIEYHADTVQISYTKNIDEFGIIDDSGIRAFPHDEAMRNLLHMRDIKEASWGKLYTREIAEKVIFPVGRLYEDVLTAYQFVYHSNVIVCDVNSKLYYYRPNPHGIMHKQLSKIRFSVLTVIKDIRLFLKSDYEKYLNDCSYYAMRHMINIYNECIVEDGDREFADIMEKIRTRLINNRQQRLWKDRKYHLLIDLLATNRRLYKRAVLLLRKRWK